MTSSKEAVVGADINDESYKISSRNAVLLITFQFYGPDHHGVFGLCELALLKLRAIGHRQECV